MRFSCGISSSAGRVQLGCGFSFLCCTADLVRAAEISAICRYSEGSDLDLLMSPLPSVSCSNRPDEGWRVIVGIVWPKDEECHDVIVLGSKYP